MNVENFDAKAGEIVDAMTAEGVRIIDEVRKQFRVAAVVGAYSSGDDSIVSTHFTMTTQPGAFVMNASTLVALSPARQHLVDVCEKMRWPLEVREAHPRGQPKRMRQGGKLVPYDPAVKCPAGKWVDGATAYEEAVLNFGFPGKGKPQHGWMYKRLKERPIRQLLRELGASGAKGGNKVLIVSGIRQDESAIRAGYKRAYREGYFGDVWVNPFYYRTAADFALYRDEFGLPRNPVKAKCGISGECCCGTFASDGEREAYAVADPEFARYLTDLEDRVKANGFPWGWGESPPAWWIRERADAKAGQGQLDFGDGCGFQPMCVGCSRKIGGQ